MRFALLVAAITLTAGCLAATDAPPGAGDGASDGLLALDGGLVFRAEGRHADLSRLQLAEGPDATVAFPPGVLVVDADGRLVPAAEPVEVASGGEVRFLPPYGVANLTLSVTAGGATQPLTVPLDATGGALYPGERVVELMKVQRDQFPHRTPGEPAYTESMAYFAAFFEELGYEVVVEEYDHAASLPVRGISPASFNNVVAYKRGTLDPERYLVFGGHFDVVEQTRDGAFDNTAGTVATMVMAEALADIPTQHTIVFGLWGGEEDGILGSQAWITRHADLVPSIDGYFNYDVTGLVWPAPSLEPSRLVVAAGPDGPVADALHAYAQRILTENVQTDAEFIYEAVAQGQATGAGVNAQSDHTPFVARGIPAYFTFTERVDDVLAIIHSEYDTVDNLTRYAYCGLECMIDVEAPLSPEELAQGEQYLARSFEVQLALGFYWVVLTDAGVLPDPRAPGLAAPPTLG